MKQILSACLFLILALVPHPSYAALCDIEITDLKHRLIWDQGTDYEPLSPRHMERIPFTIRNNGTEPCTFFISVSSGSLESLYEERYAIGNQKQEKLRYQIFANPVPDPVRVIKSRQDFLQEENVIQFHDFKAGKVLDETLFLSIDPQQLVIDDNYYDSLQLQVVSGTFDRPGPLIMTQELSFTTTVKKVVSIDFNTGGNKWVLGELTPNLESQFEFTVYSNDTYDIQLDTKNHFNLQHNKSDSIKIPYSLVVQENDKKVSTNDPRIISQNVRTSHSGSNYKMILTLPNTPFPNGSYADTLFVTLKNY